MSDVHLVPSGDDWALEVDGVKRDRFSTQNERSPVAGSWPKTNRANS
jgi:hypothetical protein